jgi:hypothetical protein
MTKRGKFGDRPGQPDDELDVATRAGAPMPLITHPMAAVRPESIPGLARSLAHTVALPHDSERGVSLEGSRPTLAMERVSPSGGLMARESPVRNEPPPEIGLTQHHLPDDAVPDPRLILHLDPDSAIAASSHHPT